MFWLTYNHQAKADFVLDKVAFKHPGEAEALREWFLEKLVYDKKVSVSEICAAALISISKEEKEIFDHIGFTASQEIFFENISVKQSSIYPDIYTVIFPLEFMELMEESA